MSDVLEQSDLREGYKEVQFGPKTLVIPNDWSAERFGDVFQRRRESIDEIDDETVKYVGLKHLDSGQLDINGYDVDGRERSSSRVFREGDVLFGKLRPNLNKAAIAPFSGVCSSDIIPIYAEEDSRQQYLPYLMHSKLVRDRVVSTMEGTNLPRTSWGDLEKTLVPLPSLPEQRRIADILSTVDKQILQTKEIIQEVEELKLGTIQDLLTKGAGQRDTSFVKVPMIPQKWELPNHWDLKFMENVTELVTDGTHQTPEYVDDGVAFLRVENIKGKNIEWDNVQQISESEYKEITAGKVPQQGDVLLSKNGTIGRTQVVEWDRKFGYYVSLCLIRPDTSIINSRYLAEVLSSEICLQQAKIRSKKATVTNLHLEEIRRFSIPIPPLETQQRIVNILAVIDSVGSAETERLKSLKKLKRGLMQDLLTGTVRVDPEQAN